MRIIDILKENKINCSHDLEVIFAKAARDHYPTMRECNWSEIDIITYVLFVDLPDEDIKNIIARASRYAKIWIFS